MQMPLFLLPHHMPRRLSMSDMPKGTILQRDKETYAIRVTPPSGVVTPQELEAVAAVARKYDVPMLKITSGQRFALIGLKEKDLHAACSELPFRVAGHYVQACPGNQWCQLARQNALEMAGVIEKKFRTFDGPAKIKMGVSGCGTCCAESYVRDIGLVGTSKGWNILVGGNSGGRARIADVLAKDLPDDEAVGLLERFLEYYKTNGKTKQRVARFVEARGIESIREALL
jgi:NAD(P)H-nitrite reductase large subunit